MSFLAPLYALGLLAISAPIIFHLIQRRPKGEQTFSSLMFLSPSPPRLTRRSRLDNLLLLLLRGCALLLLAMAFARPFLRSHLQDSFLPSRDIAILLDTSASMQRAEVWDQAKAEVINVVNDLQPHDRITLLTFDTGLTRALDWTNPQLVTPAHRIELVEDQLTSIQPGWHETNLGAALTQTLELLQDQEVDQAANGAANAQLIVVTDFQKGSDLTALAGSQWPQGVGVDLRIIAPAESSNVSLHRISSFEESDSEAIQVRVTNSSTSETTEYQLHWQDDQGNEIINSEKTILVPTGQHRTIDITRHPTTSVLAVKGDTTDFDNRIYVAQPYRGQQRLLHLGLDSDDVESLPFFVKRMDLSTPRYEVITEAQWPPSELDELEATSCPLVIVAQVLSESDTTVLQQYVKNGGKVLIILDQQHAESNGASDAIARLMDLETVQISEAEVDDYAMLQDIRFEHPLFAPFADTRFNDFTKIRVWQHRLIESDHEHPWDPLIRFDNGAPALVQRDLDEGTIWILTTGWQPKESQLALSTKFVPLLSGMFDSTIDLESSTDDYEVGDVVSFADAQESVEVIAPTGDTYRIETSPFELDTTDIPGIYMASVDGTARQFAINLSAREGQTDVMDPVELEQRGIVIQDFLSEAELTENDRQLKDVELESRQQIWRWLILGALGFLLAESWLSGRLSRQTVPSTSGAT